MSAFSIGPCRLVAKPLGYYEANGHELCCGGKGFFIINALNLCEAPCDQSGLSADQVSIRVLFGFVDPFARDNIGSLSSRDQLPHLSVDERF